MRKIYHKTIYNFASLEKLLIKSGFKDVKRYDWQKTIHKDYDDHSQAYFPHMDKHNGILISLNVEAIKNWQQKKLLFVLLALLGWEI